MEFTYWFLIVGALFIAVALFSTVLKRLPLTSAMLYVVVGIVLAEVGLIRLDPVRDAALLERVTEVAVIISLFTAGLKLRVPLSSRCWGFALRLAFLSMTLTVGLIAFIAWFALGLSVGAAILLGAILAPTDPVLASDVQLQNPDDRDRIRFSLTGEGGLNDGTAFPFVMLGLGLLGVHEIGAWGWRWLVVDVVWAIVGGVGIGALLGTLVARLVLHLRQEHQESVGLDDFLALGLIALSYGAALLLHTYGFLAVFAAGVALRRIEMQQTAGDTAPPPTAFANEDEAATHPEHAPAFMAQAVLGFNQQIERIGEVAVVVLLGGMLSLRYLPAEWYWFPAALFLAIRPLAVQAGLWSAELPSAERRLMGWFGIRGIGSLYYLAYAIHQGLPPDLAARLTSLTLTVVVASVILHGISVTPMMEWYHERFRRRTRALP